MKTIESLGDLKGKRVLVRSDFNVPLDADKNITDDGRIQAALPTLRTLLDAGAKVIITAHLGRPKGQVNSDYSLAPVAKRLAEVTGVKVTLAEDTVGESAKAAVAAAGDGEIVLLENVRFNAAETSKDDAAREAFAAELAALADVFVSDGFGGVHRRPPSTMSPSCCPRRPVCSSSRRSSPWGAPSTTPSAPTPWCSAAPRSPTSSASSPTC